MGKANGITTVIMAGGKSSRMGTDKSFVPILGKPMIEHVLDRVQGIGTLEIIISNNPENYAYLGLPIYQDLHPDLGPLGGLHAALHYAHQAYILIVACDMPWLNRSLLEYLVSLRDSADAIVPRWDRYPEPLHAVYSKSCLLPVEKKLQAHSLKLISFYPDISVNFIGKREIEKYDPFGRSFKNVNTPEDLNNLGYLE
jgi:molybdopterin-guanine dinucleotide biosynthesis protein A